MNCVPDRRRKEAYAQAHAALRKGATVIAPALAEAQTGLVVVLDIAGMSGVNSRHGSTTGDRLLRAVEESLRSELRGTAEVAMGGHHAHLEARPVRVRRTLLRARRSVYS